MPDVKKYIEENKERFLDELFELLRIPSVSAQPKHKEDVLRAAEFVRKKLEQAGADKAEVCQTGGHPAVYGEKIIGENKPTILVYGHYDVQPPDPLGEWKSSPFEPVIKDGKIFARGASDDKGQMFAHIKAFEYLMAAGGPSCNIKFLFEGEEEGGTDSTEAFVEKNAGKLKADAVIASDESMVADDIPSIVSSLRGICYLEVEVTGPDKDLHSGTYGGAVANPLNILCAMAARLHDGNNRVTVPHFYDNVRELSAAERRELKKIPFSLKKYEAEAGVRDIRGEAGYSTIERATVRPTLDLNGIWGGYTEEGSKTIIPSRAHAKISMRLVPDQAPEKVAREFIRYFRSLAPKSVKADVRILHLAEPIVIPRDFPAYRAAVSAYAKAFGKKPLSVGSGGSIPIVAAFARALGTKTVLAGFGLDTDNIHSPNESFGVFNFLKGIETAVYFFENLPVSGDK